jgi:hypothetical protein
VKTNGKQNPKAGAGRKHGRPAAAARRPRPQIVDTAGEWHEGRGPGRGAEEVKGAANPPASFGRALREREAGGASMAGESANEFLKLPNGTAHPTAWLATNDDDGPPFPVDVVFRNGWRDLPPLDDLNHFGSPVCPAETGHSKTTCKACQRCFLRRELRAVQALRVQDGGAEQRAVAVEVAGQGGTSDLAEDVARPIRRALSVDG